VQRTAVCLSSDSSPISPPSLRTALPSCQEPSAKRIVCQSRPAALTAARCSEEPTAATATWPRSPISPVWPSTSPKGCQEPSAKRTEYHTCPLQSPAHSGSQLPTEETNLC